MMKKPDVRSVEDDIGEAMHQTKAIEDMLTALLGIDTEVEPLTLKAEEVLDSSFLESPPDSPEPLCRTPSAVRKQRRRSPKLGASVSCDARKYSDPETSPGPSEGESSDEDQQRRAASSSAFGEMWQEKMKASRGKFRSLRGALIGVQMTQGPNDRPAFAAGRGCPVFH